MAEENWKAQLSVKFGRLGDMINLRADSVDDLAEMSGKLADLGTVIVASAEEFQAKATIVQTFPETTKAPASGDVCAHGVAWLVKSGEKNGKSWSGRFCQVENDPSLPKCKAKWDN